MKPLGPWLLHNTKSMPVSYTKKQKEHIPGTQRTVINVYVLAAKYQVTSYVVIAYSHIWWSVLCINLIELRDAQTVSVAFFLSMIVFLEEISILSNSLNDPISPLPLLSRKVGIIKLVKGTDKTNKQNPPRMNSLSLWVGTLSFFLQINCPDCQSLHSALNSTTTHRNELPSPVGLRS